MNKTQKDNFEGFGFESPNRGNKDEWLTPPFIISALGDFDLDPCAPVARPFKTAQNYFTIENDGLKQEWKGRVYCNPPYGTETKKWIKKLAQHGNGVALIFARTETETFDLIFRHASAFLFLARRLKFCHINGVPGKCATAPSVLAAFDNQESCGMNAQSLKRSGLRGAYFGKAIVLPQIITQQQRLVT